MEEAYKIELVNITKDFPGVRALDNVSIRVRKGTIHAIVGENGAGKSTLMKIINGSYTPDSGSIILDGKKTSIKSPLDAMDRGIAMIYQELSYFPELSIQENIYMGRFPDSRIKWFVNWKETGKKVGEMFAQHGLNYDPRMAIKNLSVSDIQMLEIMKAVSINANLIIMDEPTSAISSREIDILFKKIRQMKEDGISILYISHKLEEIFEIADEITVMRDGKVITTGPKEKFDNDSLIAAMVGREIRNIYPKEFVPIGGPILQVRNLCSTGVFMDVNLDIKKGEIVGIAGLVGAGRTELARALSGSDPITSGQILLEGNPVVLTSISSAIGQGLVMVSEDRRLFGIVGCRSIKDNILLAKHRITKGLFVREKESSRIAAQIAKELNVKAPSLYVQAEALSGGNQQKVVLAKWLLVDTKVLILDEPTRGIDVGAKYEVYKIIVELARKGVAIALISAEMPELIGMADRIYVMCKGRFITHFERAEFSQERIMKYATGGKD
jgi:inositol transport system ATP-binding protein